MMKRERSRYLKKAFYFPQNKWKGFSDSERSMYKSIVYNNIVHSMATLLKAMKNLQIHFHDEALVPISEKFFKEAESKL